ncbi:MAG: N-acetylmuramoyl-L-alanine amidase [Xanthomonadales bacterium]|nr:N-acetylmuramoyl-L-alanine amidase [Xanthomonadales bacterium]
MLTPAAEPIHDWPLPYVSALGQRAISAVDLLVIHCTELPDLATTREYGERVLYESGTGNSGHYYIERGGRVHRFVPNERIAHHVRGYNDRAIGIELLNTGRWPNWLDSRHQAMKEAYPATQIDALVRLIQQLRGELPSLRWIAGHEDLDRARVPASDDASILVPRKRDPGPLFPWHQVMQSMDLSRLEVQT